MQIRSKLIKQCLYFLLLAAFFLASCSSKAPKPTLKEFNAGKTSNDYFMKAFQDFIKTNDLGTYLAAYESQLIKNGVLANTDEKSYKEFFQVYIAEGGDDANRCISKNLRDKLFKTHFLKSRQFENISKEIEDNRLQPTKEYNFLDYVAHEGGDGYREALQYALENNTLTSAKKYFYLYCTVPFKTCD